MKSILKITTMKKIKLFLLIFMCLTFYSQSQITIDLIPNVNDHGSAILLHDDNGISPNFVLAPDVSGDGGYFFIKNGNGSDALFVDGKHGSGSIGRIGTIGPSASTFNTSVSGNSSVQLPLNAISSPEMQNEMGITNATKATATTITTATTVLVSTTINAPTTGYVLVIASGEFYTNHTTGATSGTNLGVSSTSNSLEPGNALYHRIPNTRASGVYTHSTNAQGIFPVTSGETTFYFLGDKVSGTDPRMYDATLSAVFIPTNYGTVQSNLTGNNNAPNTQQEGNTILLSNAVTHELIQQEKEISMKANDTRIKTEKEALEIQFKKAETHHINY